MVTPAPSEDLTPEDLDTALVVVVIRADGRSRLWIGDAVSTEQAADLLHAAASYLPAPGTGAAYAGPHDRHDPPRNP